MMWSRILRRSAIVVTLLAALLLSLGTSGVAQAAGGATFHDDAGLLTQTGRNRVAQAAQQANIRVLVITTRQSFNQRSDFQTWLNQQAQSFGDRGAVTIGLHAVRGQQWINASTGPDTHLSVANAGSGLRSASPTFRSSGVTAGIVQTIRNYQNLGAYSNGAASGSTSSGSTTSSGSSGGGSSFGWLIPIVVIALLGFAASRLFGRRRNTIQNVNQGYGSPGMGGPGYGNQGFGGPGYGNQGIGGPGYGNQGGRGGSFLQGLAGGAVGGVAGSFIGERLFGQNNNNNGGANNGVADASGQTDTSNAQDLQGGWDGGSGADAGGWGGDSSSGGDSGGWGGGDSGGGGGDSGGGWS